MCDGSRLCVPSMAATESVPSLRAAYSRRTALQILVPLTLVVCASVKTYALSYDIAHVLATIEGPVDTSVEHV